MKKLIGLFIGVALIGTLAFGGVGWPQIRYPFYVNLGDLQDVSSTATDSPTDNYVLTYDAATKLWGPEAAGAGSGDVTAAAVIADHTIVRGDGGVKGVQDSGITLDDTDNITGAGNITAGLLALGGAAIDTDIGVNYSKVLTDTDNSIKAGTYIAGQFSKTAAAYTSTATGAFGHAILDSTNTQNWTHGVGLRGTWGMVSTEASSTGTITGIAALVTDIDVVDAATVTNAYGLYVFTPTVAGNKVTNEYGVYVATQDTGSTLNYALYTNGGLVRLGDNLIVGTSMDAAGGISLTDDSVAGIQNYSEIAAATTLSANQVVRGIWNRMRVTGATTNMVTIAGNESQIRITDGANLGDGVHTGLWAYFEQDGTVALASPGQNSAISATVEGASTLTLDNGATLSGIVIDSSVHDDATINGDFDAIWIKVSGGKEAWEFDLRMQNDETITNVTDGYVDISGVTRVASLDGPAAALDINTATIQDVNFWDTIASGNPSINIYGWNTAGSDRESTEFSIDDTNDEFIIQPANSANHEGVTVSLQETNQRFRLRQNSDAFSIRLDGSDTNFHNTDGQFTFTTDEGAAATAIWLYDADDDHYAGIDVPAIVTADWLLTIPAAVHARSGLIVADTSGDTSWSDDWTGAVFTLVESDTAVAVVDGTTPFTVPPTMNGWELYDVIASVHDKGITSTMNIQIRKRSGGSDSDMLSTLITVGDEFYCSDEVVKNDDTEDVATGDEIYADIDQIHSGTAANGLTVTCLFRRK